MSKNNITSLAIAALVGSMITILSYSFLNGTEYTTTEKLENKPLYWKAPMDDNYRRDKPGKSPMGMDLVPVYAIEKNNQMIESGEITISPEMINNLGVRIDVAKMVELDTQIKTVGYVTYDQDQLIHIHPRVEGWIEKLYIKAAGDPVKQDQPIYDIYSPALVNAQEELILALDRKNQRLVQAAVDRLKALQLPKIAIDNLIKTKKVQQTITFYAPQTGVVDNLNIREGFFAKPGTTLMSIGKLDQVWVEAEVFERQASDVGIGLAVTMTLDYLPGKKWQGKVDYVYPTLDEKNRTIKVRLRFENSEHQLKPNMFAQVVIHQQSQQQSLVIPKQSVIRSGDSNRVVLALGEGRFKSVEIQVGRFNNNYAEVLSGLNEGEKIVSSAQFLLDSESSKTSDFKRMSQMDNDMNVNVQSASEINKDKQINSATTTGTINSIMADSINSGHKMLNISRAAIEKWNRPAATLDFMVSDNVDISNLSINQNVMFTFHIKDGQFIITNIHDMQTAHQIKSQKMESQQ